MTSIACTLQVTRCPLDAEDFLCVTCPDCCGSVVIHQPDERRPDRLLGTCGSCSAWFLIAPAAASMVRLPDEAALDGPRTASPQPVAAALVGEQGE
jgi:hypothetical protein